MSANAETFELGFVPMLSESGTTDLGIKQEIDRENNTIFGAQVTKKGEALGHDLMLDDKFLNRIVELGNAQDGGVKMRAGHPAFMGNDPIGSFLGVRKNFVRKGDFVFADMVFSSAANEQMKNHIFAMAEEHPSMLGNSAVVQGKRIQPEDDSMPVLVAEGLAAVDVVDTPAAGTGMFSVNKQLLDGEQEKQEVNSMAEEVKEELAALKTELVEEQLKARDAELAAANEEIASLKREIAITKTEATVSAALSASDLPEAAREKLAAQFKDAESCDDLDENIASMSEFIKAVQMKAEDKEEEAETKVIGMGVDTQNTSGAKQDHEGRISAMLKANEGMSYADAYKATMTEEDV
jgi:ribosomal protein L29